VLSPWIYNYLVFAREYALGGFVGLIPSPYPQAPEIEKAPTHGALTPKG